MPSTLETNVFWLRDEVKPGEKRTPILPEHAKKLIEAGHVVMVEASETRCVSNEEYQSVGCKIVPSGSWKTMAPTSAIILGLKELDIDSNNSALVHRHIYFGHAYKNQTGWKDLLNRFLIGGGSLLDLEFLTYDNGARVAAFGRSAGFIGAALGILNWCFQQSHTEINKLLPSLDYYKDFAQLVSVVSEKLKSFERKPKILVIGALGRCGRGAVSLCEQVGLYPSKWDINETQGGGPFLEILEYDILVNCIYLAQPISPFITSQLLDLPNRKLTNVVDVSCDFTNPNNPIPIYFQGTTFSQPTIRIAQDPVLDVISIDHLPSLVPFESSKEFADSLIQHLVSTESDVWKRCNQIFLDKTEPLKKELKKQLQHIWLREETLDNERRTALTPQDAKKLVEQGFNVTVERSTKRIFSDDEYLNVGCSLVEAGSWKDAPLTATILGNL
jgi:saccharopine dehydrogenase (NAD+, L-lysine-forming)